MPPFFSICIPTYNRAALLDYCLTKLEPLESIGIPFEIVVSDNASPDNTPEIIQKHQKAKPYLRSCRQNANVSAVSNWINSFREAKGDYLIYVADDDAVIAANLRQHLLRLEREPNILGLYTDWMAYDDDKDQEIHRYLRIPPNCEFGPNDNPLNVVNFVLQNQIYPEMAIYKRETFFKSHTFVSHQIPFQQWLYRLTRQGRVVFESLPYYKENRVLKPQFRRDHWANMDIQHQYVGDELRIALETMVLWAFQDSGLTQAPPDQVPQIKMAIDQFLHNKTMTNVYRACSVKKWILALELRRRLVLWHGPGPGEQQSQDIMNITIPAACQSVRDTYQCLPFASGILFQGFQTTQIPDFFRAHYPEVPLLQLDLEKLPENQEKQPLIVIRDAAFNTSHFPKWLHWGYRMHFDQLVDNCRVNHLRIDLANL